ncbi:MAG: hypothetical protein AB1414_14490 [bacterium]
MGIVTKGVTVQDIATESQRTQREYITTNEHKYKKIRPVRLGYIAVINWKFTRIIPIAMRIIVPLGT